MARQIAPMAEKCRCMHGRYRLLNPGRHRTRAARGQAIDNALIELRQRLSRLPAPVIVYSKSHSGSRLLAQALDGQGLFIGAERNQSEDALPILPVVEACVRGYYPDYARLWASSGREPAELAAATLHGFERHLAGYDPASGRAWGWKLCESHYALPFFAFLFPHARVVHLLRDGRDVAWSDHVAPEQLFWRKIYFNTDGIQRWRGRALTNAAYERASHLYNALHWKNSVETGRAYGNMLGERYREVRYEPLCTDFIAVMTSLLDWLGLAVVPPALEHTAGTVFDHAIGKHRKRPRRQNRAVLRLIEPTLISLGYMAPGRADDDVTGSLLARLGLRRSVGQP